MANSRSVFSDRPRTALPLDIAGECVGGKRIRDEGRVLDGEGIPIPDAIIEIWQANVHGKYAHPEDMQDKPLEPVSGAWGAWPRTTKVFFVSPPSSPALFRDPSGAQAPHLVVVTSSCEVYCEASSPGHTSQMKSTMRQTLCCILIAPERRATLMLQPSPNDPSSFAWTIRMQGDGETVFFDC